jgi:16S rRNA (adenine1518-N6/adenine1519-N6)-dimethyltransferase
MDTNKKLGQHWLHDEASLQAMCDAAEVSAGDTVLEIGPGLGTLTAALLDRGARVVCVEFDMQLVPGLKKKFGKNPLFSIVHQDILRFDFSVLPSGYKVVANIPYYLTSNLLRRMHEAAHAYSQAALLMQKEVAQRVCATPGDMSILSVSTQLFSTPHLGLEVPAHLFTPPPKVDSQILSLRYKTTPQFEGLNTVAYLRIVKAGFSEKRKMLRSSLSSGLGLPKTEVEALCQKAGINPQLRAQTLSLEDWYRLYKARRLSSQRK